MNNKELINLVSENLKDFLEENHYELFDIQYLKEGPNWYLRVFIDKEGGVAISDCEIVTRHLNKFLDEVDPIKNPYILEVSSPGIDRPLKTEKDFISNINKLVDVKLYKNFQSSKEFCGEIVSYEDKKLTLKLQNTEEEICFELKDIASCRLSVIF